MPSIQETAYPRFKSTLSPKELTAIYTPTLEELDFAEQVTVASHATRLGLCDLIEDLSTVGLCRIHAGSSSSVLCSISPL